MATAEICNSLPYDRLSDPLGRREEAADRAKRSGGGSPGFTCAQPLVEAADAAFGDVKVELDFAFTESVDFAKDVFGRGREDSRKDMPDKELVEVNDVGREATRLNFDKPTDMHQVRELQVWDSNLPLTVTITAEARHQPKAEGLKPMDTKVDSFARGVLDALRT
ncbi:hypothetical protein [Streptomyces sp. G-G2]|uniref:hypothetical protein n=1 Tax=Streptomyces sp. G-G2 TaxID=3046201 RepID=UPI0024B90229|nr:hypothetical protein [Streptomyces sp. G-G2]MDJ0382749.1 hypothetical protein [Streptomyces sp. G-G2]